MVAGGRGEATVLHNPFKILERARLLPSLEHHDSGGTSLSRAVILRDFRRSAISAPSAGSLWEWSRKGAKAQRSTVANLFPVVP